MTGRESRGVRRFFVIEIFLKELQPQTGVGRFSSCNRFASVA